jgi:hypothetical protein
LESLLSSSELKGTKALMRRPFNGCTGLVVHRRRRRRRERSIVTKGLLKTPSRLTGGAARCKDRQVPGVVVEQVGKDLQLGGGSRKNAASNDIAGVLGAGRARERSREGIVPLGEGLRHQTRQIKVQRDLRHWRGRRALSVRTGTRPLT